MRLEGRRVILTGACGRVGRATAVALAAQGAWVVVSGCDREPLEALAGEIRCAGGHADVIVTNLAEPAGPRQLVRRALDFDPLIDLLVNCADESHSAPFEGTPAAVLERLWQSNVLVPMRLAQEVLPVMRRRRSGLIVNVGSVHGAIGLPGCAGYATTQFGLRGFSESLRRELQGSGVNVLYFAPRLARPGIAGEARASMAVTAGIHREEHARVADALVAAIRGDRRDLLLGAPERFCVRLNALFPRLVDLFVSRPEPESFALTDAPARASLLRPDLA